MNQPKVLDEEFIVQGRVIISETDLEGNIIYANQKFCEVSGYNEGELLGRSHNIVRHPDMPKVIYEKMWNTIKSGQIWNGIIKGLRKDGKYYWVQAEILPYRDKNDKITGYVAARKPASRQNIQEISKRYYKMRENEF